jgi:hypothetical protein
MAKCKIPKNPYAKDCSALTDAQWSLMKYLYRVPTVGRFEHQVERVMQDGYQYKTLEVLAEHRIVKLRVWNMDTKRYVRVRLTKFGHDLAAFRAEYLHVLGIAIHLQQRVKQVLDDARAARETLGRYWPVGGK